MGFAGWFKNIFRPKSADGAINTSKELADFLLRGGWKTKAGITITPAVALEIPAVQAAVGLITETVARLPLPIYKDTDQGREKTKAHWAHTLLNVAPNGWQNHFEFFEMFQGWLMLEGMAVAVKNALPSGEIRELLPIHPTRVRVEFDNARMRRTYKITTPNGVEQSYDQSQVFAIHDRTYNGVQGASRIGLAREGLAAGKAAENFGGAFFGNSGQPAGTLSTDKPLTAKQVKDLQDSWKSAQGGDNAFAVAVLDNGFKFTPITALLKDAQFIEFRKFFISEVSRIWRIPPHMLADLEKATFSNIEEQGREFVTYCLDAWLGRWEAAINTQIIAPQRQSPHFAEFNVNGLLRGNIDKRYASYSIGLRNGWLSVNEVRELENLNKIPGGDDYVKAASIFGGEPGGATDDKGQSNVAPQPA